MDLGPDPERYIEYPGGNSFYVAETVEDRLEGMGVEYTTHELESLFLPFLDPEIRRIVQRFDRGSCNRPRYTREEILSHQRDLHTFDKRRLHYLRCGRVDIGNLELRPWKFLNVLLEKSRDEIESLFGEMERELPPHEIRTYLFTALHLQTHFRHLLTRHQPWSLNPDKVDHYFTEDLCRLNQDEAFFRGVGEHEPQWLHPYLVRYLILYFDEGFDPQFRRRADADNFVRGQGFSRSRPPRKTSGLSILEKEACGWLGFSPAQFAQMDRSELVSHFRQRAMECHPDRGGDPEAFVKIQEAYVRLRRRKQ
jgi:hypothetical protein